ncbi:hypothetical protein [Burkholderia pseudomallei]|uniref:hypothetical protein n=1 Tax=Burkholderia pseudomallei TaxID=28450 RepID=UPI000CCE80FC|nr:hypothetical protein [Burkholderia pseudomallei]PNW89191.1 hypothetical protein CF640_36960 [Burkholderia pseudomallei]
MCVIGAGAAVRARPAFRRPPAGRAGAGRSRRRLPGERAVAGVQGPGAAAAAVATATARAMAMAANDVARRRTDADRRGHAGASPRAPVVDPVRPRMPAAATVPPLA